MGQSNLFRCNNRACGRPPKGFVFCSDAAAPACPRGGKENPPGTFGPQLHHLVFIPLVVMHPDGPIWGGEGRQYVACEKKRDGLAKFSGDQYAATDDVRVVNCPSCKTTPIYLALAKMYPELAVPEAVKGG